MNQYDKLMDHCIAKGYIIGNTARIEPGREAYLLHVIKLRQNYKISDLEEMEIFRNNLIYCHKKSEKWNGFA